MYNGNPVLCWLFWSKFIFEFKVHLGIQGLWSAQNFSGSFCFSHYLPGARFVVPARRDCKPAGIGRFLQLSLQSVWSNFHIHIYYLLPSLVWSTFFSNSQFWNLLFNLVYIQCFWTRNFYLYNYAHVFVKVPWAGDSNNRL